MWKYADKPDADVAYLTAALTRAALVNKFRELFGREPVAGDVDTPMMVKDARVPEIVLAGIDHDIIPLLVTCAVEQSKNVEGVLPELNGRTLLYVIHDDAPASVSLEAVKEYADLPDDAREVVVGDAAASASITIEDGVAYLPKATSTIEIGVYVDEAGLAEEFQYRLKSQGGEQLPQDAKVRIFDELFNDLPGGESNKEQAMRSRLLAVVGLAEVLPAAQRPVAEDMRAPGPGGEPAPAEGAEPPEAHKSEPTPAETP